MRPKNSEKAVQFLQQMKHSGNKWWRYAQFRRRAGRSAPGWQSGRYTAARASRPGPTYPQLQRGLAPLYVLHGDEALLQQEAADAIRAAARAQGYTERSSFTVAGAHFDWGAVLAAGAV